MSATWASNTITINGTPTASGTFSYSIPLSGGCGNISATGSITANPLPTAAISGNTAVCGIWLSSISIALTGTAPWYLEYTDGSTLTSVNDILSSPYTFTVSPASTTTWTVTYVEDASGCSNTGTGSATVIVNNVVGGEITRTQPIDCNADPSPIASQTPGTGSGIITYQWQSAVNALGPWTTISGATLETYNPPGRQ